MKKLLLLSLIGFLSACASDFDKRRVQYARVQNTGDSKIKLQLLEKQKVEDCQKNINYYDCAEIAAKIAAVATLQTQQYDLAIQNAEIFLGYRAERWKKEKNYSTSDYREKINYYCNTTWNVGISSSYSEKQNLPQTFPMIYFLALKGAKNPRAKDFLNIAYLCELTTSYDSFKIDKILQEYMENSMQLHDKADQVYVKRFIGEIYKPIEHSLRQLSKDYSVGLRVQADAKTFLLYKNALVQSRKIGLPQIYQDYLNYWVVVTDHNK